MILYGLRMIDQQLDEPIDESEADLEWRAFLGASPIQRAILPPQPRPETFAKPEFHPRQTRWRGWGPVLLLANAVCFDKKAPCTSWKNKRRRRFWSDSRPTLVSISSG
jgi:hypothetical protein